MPFLSVVIVCAWTAWQAEVSPIMLPSHRSIFERVAHVSVAATFRFPTMKCFREGQNNT